MDKGIDILKKTGSLPNVNKCKNKEISPRKCDTCEKIEVLNHGKILAVCNRCSQKRKGSAPAIF